LCELADNVIIRAATIAIKKRFIFFFCFNYFTFRLIVNWLFVPFDIAKVRQKVMPGK